MDGVTHVCKEREASAVRFEIPLISVKATAFNKDVPPLLSSYRKVLCMNMKESNVLRVLGPQGSYAETTVGTPLLRHLVSSEGYHDHCAFFAVGGKKVMRLRPLSQANGEMQIESREMELQEELYAIAVADGGIAYAIGESLIFEVDMETKTTRASMKLVGKTTVKHPVIAYHKEAKLVLAPAKTNCLDLFSATSCASVLPKVWEPHANSVPTAAFFIQHRGFSSESAQNIFIVTATRGNSELRFWSYNKSTGTFSLQQDICISIEDLGDGEYSYKAEGDEPFLLNCTVTEDYIILCSQRRPLAVVLELHRSKFKVNRITSWKIQGPALSSVATVGKIAENASSTSVELQPVITIRSASGFYKEVLDVEKLAGASNTSTLRQDSTSLWFPNCDIGNVESTAMLPVALTSVSSSVLGDKTTNTVSQMLASKIVCQQATYFCNTLRDIDERIGELQKQASDAMRLFQEARARDEAQTVGRKFAMRNRGRLEQLPNGTAGQPDDILSVYQELLEQIGAIVEDVETTTLKASSEVLKSFLPERLKEAIGKRLKEVEQMDMVNIAPPIRSTESMRLFSNGVDRAMRTFISAIKDYHNSMQLSLNASATNSNPYITEVKKFSETLNDELRLLKRELRETTESVSSFAAVNVPLDPDALVLRAVSLAEAGEWARAFTVVLGESNISVLLPFLESNVCQNNTEIIFKPGSITLPLFLSLCLQLSNELSIQPAYIPLRIELLLAVYMEWDDALNQMQKEVEENDQQKSMVDVIRRELSNVLKQLTISDDVPLNRRTRNNLRLLCKMITSFCAIKKGLTST